MKKYTFYIILALFFISSCTTQENRKIDFVNPFIGTGGHGHTFPGATLPFGMVQLSPDTRLTGWDGCSGYHDSDRVVYGFSHTHLSGTGVGDYCDILLMPTVGELEFTSGYISEEEKTNKGYGSSFKKESESATAGYYSVFLEDYKIKAEMTTSLRCGVHKYTFPESEKSNIIIDLTHRDEVLNSSINFISDTEIEGYRISNAWAKEQYVYFYAKFSKPFLKHGISENDTLKADLKTAEGKNIKAYINFLTEKDEEITVKVGISAVSAEGAKKNFEEEVNKKSFDEVKTEAETIWEKELSVIDIEGGTDEQKTIFYTSLYHTLIVPNTFQDVDGKYRGTDLKIHENTKGTNYTIFSLWDTYRATHPLYTIIQQEKTNEFINTFHNQFKHGGQLPVWELAGNYTGCMIGYHSIPVIADAYLKGIVDYDIEELYKAMKHSAEAKHLGLEEYQELCYIPANYEHEAVSKALEYAYDDWCIAQVAKKLGKMDDYKTYIQRAQYYKNMFEPTSGFMRSKRDARWVVPFDPSEVNFNFTEANAWQYTFYVPQDVTGLINLLGGKDKLDKKLDNLFYAKAQTAGRHQVDITGLIGQYAHGNEPSHHMAYLYSFAGQPYKTQDMVTRLCNEMYTDKPDGLIGNEDCGQMSAWYVLSAMGFYSVTPAADYYVIGTPLFDKVTIHLENGKDFVISAIGNSKHNHYIESATLNNTPLKKSYLNHADIMNGGELSFKMRNRPSKWGTEDENIPKTEITDNIITAVPYAYADKAVFEDTVLVELGTIDKDAKIYYTIDDSEPTVKSKLYQEKVLISETTRIKFFAVTERGESKVMSALFSQIPKGRTLILKTAYSEQYTAGSANALVDGVQGVHDFRLGDWQGYQEVNVEAVVDFGKEKEVKELAIRFLQDINSWIFMPTEVEFFTSDDGENFKSLGKVKTYIAQDNWDVQLKEYKVEFAKKKTRYIKVVGKNMGLCPENHKAAGHKAWIFADEIVIK